MRLSDIVGNSKVTTLFTEIGLVMFLAIFVGVLIYAFLFLKKEQVEYLGALPLDTTDSPPISISSQNESTSSLDKKGE